MNFISCVKWVKQGASKNIPDNIDLNEEELEQLVDDDSSSETFVATSKDDDEYNLENYDKEDDSLRASLKGVVAFDKSKKKAKKKRRASSDDSEKEDDIIKDDDNLILVGHVDEDLNTMNVYVYNEKDGDMYIHHDLILKSPALCVEWLSCDESGYSNMCAIGSMKPVIELWDLDIFNCVEPVFKLGRSKKKSPEKNFGHTEAVLSLAWNEKLPHILCSGSVDKRGLLWDLHSGKVDTEMTKFKDDLQALSWNPHNPYHLLTGCKDGYVRNFDCRTYDDYQKFKLKSPVESILWDTSQEYCSYAGTENGMVYALDWRSKKIVNSWEAHQKEVTGLNIDRSRPHVLITISTDEQMKCWDMESEIELVHSRDLKLGALHCIDTNPNYPHIACIGGSQETRNKKILKVVDVNDIFTKADTTVSEARSKSQSSLDSYQVPLLEVPHRSPSKPKPSKFKSKSQKSSKVSKKKQKA